MELSQSLDNSEGREYTVDYRTIVPERPALKSTLKSGICPRQIVIYAGAIEKAEDLINLVTSAFQRKMYMLLLRLIQAYSLKDRYRAKAQRLG